MSNSYPEYKLVLFDVDGVLNDGTLWINAEGEVVKPFNAKDGFGFSILRQFGVRAGVLSGKDSQALRYRCKQLSMDVVLLGKDNKWAALSAFLQGKDIEPEEVVFVGDDVNDLEVISRVGYSYAPADAHQFVISTASTVCRSKGGRGVVREVAEDVLVKRGMSLEEIYKPYLSNNRNVDYEQ